MNISISKGISSLRWLVPFIALVISFFGITNTTIKIIFMAFALLFFQMRNIFRLIDFQIISLFLFLVIYVLIGSYGNNYEIIGFTTISFPVFAYLVGKWFGYAAPSEIVIKNGIFFLALSLASFPIILVSRDIIQNGFSGGVRSIYIEQYEIAISATIMAGFLTFLISQIGSSFAIGFKLRSVTRLIANAIFATLISIIIFRLGSRTQLVILGFCVYSGYLYSLSEKKTSKKILALIVLAGLIAAGISLINSFLEDSYLSEYYQDRIASGEYGVSTLGGRLDRWMDSFYLFMSAPGGWSLGYKDYAHNLWLDAARVSGIIGLSLLLLFTLISFHTFISVMRIIKNPQLKAGVGLGALSLLALFMIEPILDGYFYVFSCFCAFLGIVSGVLDNNLYIKSADSKKFGLNKIFTKK